MHTIEIADPAGLQSVLEEIRKKHRTDVKAAEELGLTRDTFRNLRTSRVTDSMAFDTFAAIFTYLGGDPRRFGRGPWPTEFALGVDEFDQEGLDPEKARDLETVRRRTQAKGGVAAVDPQAFLDAEAQAAYDLYEHFMKSVVLEDVEFVWSNYEEWMRRELRRLRPRAEPILRELWDYTAGGRQPYRPLLRRFLGRVGRPDNELPADDDLRCWLALYRSVDPLADTYETWGIERTWKEMDGQELKAYLKAALKREELRLDPPEDLRRVARGKVPWDRLEREAAKDALFEEQRYRYWLRKEVQRLRGEACWSVFRWVRRQPDCREIIADHLEAATGVRSLPAERERRQWLALLRAIEPLAVRSGGVERSAAELHRAGALETYLRNALTNERILLDREDADIRLQRRRGRDLDWLEEALAEAEEEVVSDEQEEGEAGAPGE